VVQTVSSAFVAPEFAGSSASYRVHSAIAKASLRNRLAFLVRLGLNDAGVGLEIA
jgi:hypothetical protein